MFIFCVLACLGVISFINEFVKKLLNVQHNDLLEDSFLSDLDTSNETLVYENSHLKPKKDASKYLIDILGLVAYILAKIIRI